MNGSSVHLTGNNKGAFIHKVVAFQFRSWEVTSKKLIIRLNNKIFRVLSKFKNSSFIGFFPFKTLSFIPNYFRSYLNSIFFPFQEYFSDTNLTETFPEVLLPSEFNFFIFMNYIFICGFFGGIFFSNFLFVIYFVFLNWITKLNPNTRLNFSDNLSVASAILIILKFSCVNLLGYYPPFYINLILLGVFSGISYYYSFMKYIKLYFVKFIFTRPLFISERTITGYDHIEYLIINFPPCKEDFNKKKTFIQTSVENFFLTLILLRLVIISEPYLFLLCRMLFISFLIINKYFFFVFFFGLIGIFSRIIFFISDFTLTEHQKTYKDLILNEDFTFYAGESGSKFEDMILIYEYLKNPEDLPANNHIIISPNWKNAKILYYLSLRTIAGINLHLLKDETVYTSTYITYKEYVEEYRNNDEPYKTGYWGWRALFANNLNSDCQLVILNKKNSLFYLVFFIFLGIWLLYSCKIVEIFSGLNYMMFSTLHGSGKLIRNVVVSPYIPAHHFQYKNDPLEKNKLPIFAQWKFKKNIENKTKNTDESINTHYTIEGKAANGAIIRIPVSSYRAHEFSVISRFSHLISSYPENNKNHMISISGRAVIIYKNDPEYPKYLSHYQDSYKDVPDQSLATRFTSGEIGPSVVVSKAKFESALKDVHFNEFNLLSEKKLPCDQYQKIIEVEYLLNILSMSEVDHSRIINTVETFCNKMLNEKKIPMKQKAYCKQAIKLLDEYKQSNATSIFQGPDFAYPIQTLNSNIERNISNLNENRFTVNSEFLTGNGFLRVITTSLEHLYVVFFSSQQTTQLKEDYKRITITDNNNQSALIRMFNFEDLEIIEGKSTSKYIKGKNKEINPPENIDPEDLPQTSEK